MKNINYVSAPAGSGKTHQLVEHSVAQAKLGNKYIIAQPTKQLIEQTLKNITDKGFEKATAIYKINNTDNVSNKIADFLSSAIPDEGQILLITHEALRRIKDKGMLKHWHLVVDEFMGVFDHLQLRIAKTHNIVTDHLELTEEVASGISVVKQKNVSDIEALLINKSEDMNVENFAPLLNAIQSPDHKVYVDTAAYNDLINNPETSGKMDFFSILEPTFVSEFKSVTFLGANAESTEMFVIWKTLFDVKWKPHKALSKGLLYQGHKSGPRLTISYLFDNVWSKSHAASGDEGSTTLDKVGDFINRHFENEDFLWHANANVKDTFFDPYKRLPSVSHGLDKEDYRKCNRVVLMSALNRRDEAYKFLNMIGIETETAHAMISCQADYQAMMRCSLRDPNSITEVEIVVGSKINANWLAKRFPDCVVRQLNHGMDGPKKRGRPANKNSKSAKERMAEMRARKKAEKLNQKS